MSGYGLRIVLIAGLAIFMSLSPGLANAEDDKGDGFFIAGGVYWALVDDSLESVDLDDNSAAWTFNLGYRFNKWIAIDGGYWGLGEFSFDDDDGGGKVDVGAWTLGGMASVPVWIIDLYARAGVAFWDREAKYDGGKDDESSTDWYGGLGLAFNVGDHIDLYGEWDRFFLETDYDVLGLGVRWTF